MWPFTRKRKPFQQIELPIFGGTDHAMLYPGKYNKQSYHVFYRGIYIGFMMAKYPFFGEKMYYKIEDIGGLIDLIPLNPENFNKQYRTQLEAVETMVTLSQKFVKIMANLFDNKLGSKEKSIP